MTVQTARYTAATLIAVALVAAAHASSSRKPSTEQVFVAPRAQAENVRFAQSRPGLIEVTYDLVSDDPRAVFSVTLDASDDGGQTWNVKPKNMTGDVGANVTPGTGKRIVWEAGKDVEVLRFDQFRFRLNPVAARLPPLRTATGGLSVQTTPAGATVLVDGQARGSTPTVIGDLSPGAHQLTLRRDGFLENQSTVQVRPNAVDTVSIVLTAATPNATPIVQAPRGGSNLKWLLLGGAGAAVAGVAATRGGGGAAPAPVTTTTTTTTIPPRAAVLTVASTPNPVPFRVGSGAPCNGTAGFWMYGETVRETAGVAVNITQIFLRFLGPDPFPTSPGAANDSVAANGSINYSWTWCFTPPITRMVRSTYSGRDANGNSFSFDGPIVVLSPGPGFQ